MNGKTKILASTIVLANLFSAPYVLAENTKKNESIATNNKKSIEDKCNFTRDLKPKDKGEDVRCLQGIVGVPDDKANGYYGPLTKDRVKNWQKENAVKPITGTFASKSRNKYNELSVKQDKVIANNVKQDNVNESTPKSTEKLESKVSNKVKATNQDSNLTNKFYDPIFASNSGTPGVDNGYNLIILDENGQMSEVVHMVKGYETKVGTVSGLRTGITYLVALNNNNDKILSLTNLYSPISYGELSDSKDLLTKKEGIGYNVLVPKKAGAHYFVVTLENEKGGKEVDVLEAIVENNTTPGLIPQLEPIGSKHEVESNPTPESSTQEVASTIPQQKTDTTNGFVAGSRLTVDHTNMRIKGKSVGFEQENVIAELGIGYDFGDYRLILNLGFNGRNASKLNDGRFIPVTHKGSLFLFDIGLLGSANLGSGRFTTNASIGSGFFASMQESEDLRTESHRQGVELQGSLAVPNLFLYKSDIGIGSYVSANGNIFDITQSIVNGRTNQFNRMYNSRMDGGLTLRLDNNRFNADFGILRDSLYTTALKPNLNPSDLRATGNESVSDLSHAVADNVTGSNFVSNVRFRPWSDRSIYVSASGSYTTSLIGVSNDAERREIAIGVGGRNASLTLGYSNFKIVEQNRTVSYPGIVVGTLSVPIGLQNEGNGDIKTVLPDSHVDALRRAR